MIHKLVFIGMLLSFIGIQTFAQMDSVLLDSTVIDARGKTNVTKINSFDDYGIQSIGNVLNDKGLSYVKSAAGNSLSTLSIRGGTAEQTTVLWNGLSLQNTLNGNVDLSLIPSQFFDAASLNASSSTNTGSGSIAGSIDLVNTSLDTNQPVKSIFGYGSFNTYQIAHNHVLTGKTSTHGIRVFTASSSNNYNYRDIDYKRTIRRLEHANYLSTGVLYQLKKDFKKHNPLNFRAWMQYNNREIPATLLESASKKYQTDKSVRLQSDWKLDKKKLAIDFIGGAFYEGLNYQDSLAKIYNDYGFWSNALLIHSTYKINKTVQFGIDIENRYFIGDADTFYQQNRGEFAQGVHIKYGKKKWLIHAGARLVEYTNSNDIPLVSSLIISRRVKSKWLVIAKHSNNYRMPTFNNLYWNPGGNPDLLSETSMNQEINIHYKKKKYICDVTVFSTVVNNQIRWLPNDNGLFVAQQITNSQHWNRGVEIHQSYAWKKWEAKGNYTMLLSTLADFGQPLGGVQQTFIPQSQGNLQVQYGWKKFHFLYGVNHIGKRFTNTINSEFLPQVTLHHTAIRYTKDEVTCLLTVRNGLNKYYTLTPFIPNPTRSITINFIYTINKNQK